MASCSSKEILQQNCNIGCGKVEAGEEEAPKTILITGVSQGLGRALALELANRGHTLIGCARNQTNLDSLHSQLFNLSPSPPNHLLLNIDVKSNTNVEEMARIVMEKNGVPDIIVNNAAVINENGKMWEVPEEEFDKVIDINVKGTANVLRHFIPLMIPKNKGIIVNMSSISGRTGIPLLAPYGSSKWAIEGLTKSVAKELPNGMAIVALDPGFIYTDMLVSCLGDLAPQYQSPEHWVSKAVSMILDITSMDNGASLSVNDPGVLPSNLDSVMEKC